MQILRKIMKDLIQTEIGLLFLVLLLFWRYLKNSEKNSENEHLTGHFQSFFCCFFFRPHRP